MATMQAAFLSPPQTISIETIAVPVLEPDQVLVRVAAVGVCGSDVHYYEHGRIGSYVVDAPLILGHELSGQISAVGERVNPARIGERVAIEPQRPCRVCQQCKSGQYNLCPAMQFFATPPIHGAFAEFVAIQSDFAFAIPNSVSDEAAALMEPLSVGIWACQKAAVGPNSRVLITGAGPIGVILAQTARAFGAAEVFVAEIDPWRRDMATRFGATAVFENVPEGLEVDAFIDATGAPSAVRAGIHAVCPAGRVILVGLGADNIELPVSIIQNKEIWLSGVFRYTNTWPLAIKLVHSGKVNLDALVTAKFGIADTERALSCGREPGQFKVIVYPGR